MDNVIQFPGSDEPDERPVHDVQEPLVINLTLPPQQRVSPITVALAWALVSFFSITVVIGVFS